MTMNKIMQIQENGKSRELIVWNIAERCFFFFLKKRKPENFSAYKIKKYYFSIHTKYIVDCRKKLKITNNQNK